MTVTVKAKVQVLAAVVRVRVPVTVLPPATAAAVARAKVKARLLARRLNPQAAVTNRHQNPSQILLLRLSVAGILEDDVIVVKVDQSLDPRLQLSADTDTVVHVHLSSDTTTGVAAAFHLVAGHHLLSAHG